MKIFSPPWLELHKDSLRGLSEFSYLYQFRVKPPHAMLQAIFRRNSCPVYPAGLAVEIVDLNMIRRAARADFFDASALVKVFVDEPASEIVREYWYSRSTKYTTPFCFYEAMNVLKGKWKYKGQITEEKYLDATFHLTAWFGASSAAVKHLDFTNPLIFSETKSLAERNGLDLSDAFQIMSVKRGYFSVLANESATVLVTADQDLAEAARSEELRVWNCMLEAAPE